MLSRPILLLPQGNGLEDAARPTPSPVPMSATQAVCKDRSHQAPPEAPPFPPPLWKLTLQELSGEKSRVRLEPCCPAALRSRTSSAPQEPRGLGLPIRPI